MHPLECWHLADARRARRGKEVHDRWLPLATRTASVVGRPVNVNRRVSKAFAVSTEASRVRLSRSGPALADPAFPPPRNDAMSPAPSAAIAAMHSERPTARRSSRWTRDRRRGASVSGSSAVGSGRSASAVMTRRRYLAEPSPAHRRSTRCFRPGGNACYLSVFECLTAEPRCPITTAVERYGHTAEDDAVSIIVMHSSGWIRGRSCWPGSSCRSTWGCNSARYRR